MKALAAFLMLANTALAAAWGELPLVPLLHDADINVVEKDFDTLHPWKPGSPLPTNFTEAGLEAPVTLVACDIYFDGGSKYYLFRGSNNRYLMVCTDPGAYASPSGDNAVPVEKPRLFLAASHFTGKRKVVVPLGSACERFLIKAINSEVNRIVPSPSGSTVRPMPYQANGSPRGVIGIRVKLDIPGLGLASQHPRIKSMIIDSVIADSPAERAGLHAEDTVVRIDSHPIVEMSLEDVQELIGSKAVGDSIVFDVMPPRSASAKRVKVVLGRNRSQPASK